MNRGRNTRLFDIIVDTRIREVLVELRRPRRPSRSPRTPPWRRRSCSTPANRNVTARRGVDLAAGGQEYHLVRSRVRPAGRGLQRPFTSARIPTVVWSSGIGSLPSSENRVHRLIRATPHTARRRPQCGRCPWSAGRGQATAGARWSWAAASTGWNPSAGRTVVQRPEPRFQPLTSTPSCRARPSSGTD